MNTPDARCRYVVPARRMVYQVREAGGRVALVEVLEASGSPGEGG